MEKLLADIIALEVVFGFLFFSVGGVVLFFFCRLMLAVAKWFEYKSEFLRNELMVRNYSLDD